MLGTPPWETFIDVARSKADISLHRPFYPHAAGGTRRRHLVDALGLASEDDLYRRCDVATGRRACPLFWTLGSNQVGKGALTGWREVVMPARTKGSVSLWPFDGTLAELLGKRQAVIVETYPGDVYSYVGATLPATSDGRGKRVQASRAQSAPGVLAWTRKAGVDLTSMLEAEIRNGFGADDDGEDRFDATVGVLGMLAVLLGLRAENLPIEATVRQVEGWILGRVARVVRDGQGSA
jgi:hypothetical protein